MNKTEYEKWLRHEEGVVSNGTPGEAKGPGPEAAEADDDEYSEI